MATLPYDKAVIFGAGQVGLTLAEQLTGKGVQVTLVSRRGKVNEPLPAGASIVAGDLYDAATVTRLAKGADVVFETAQPGYTEWPTQWPPLIESVIAGMAATQARLIFVDNLYMYGSTHGKPIREDSPLAATGHKGKTRILVANKLFEAHKAGKIRMAIGRAADFFGPRATDTAVFGDRFFEAAFAGKAADTFGDTSLPHTYTYVPDFARALITLSEHEEALGKAWHVPNHTTLSTQAMIKHFEAEIGQPIKTRTVNRFMLTMVGMFVPIVREMKEIAYEFEEPYVVDDSQFRAAFGAQTTPTDEAVRATVAWFRQHAAAQKQAA